VIGWLVGWKVEEAYCIEFNMKLFISISSCHAGFVAWIGRGKRVRKQRGRRCLFIESVGEYARLASPLFGPRLRAHTV
jgi:hypothetical protein